MNIIYFLAPLALLLGLAFAISFIVATRQGQFDDVETPSRKMLLNDEPITQQTMDALMPKTTNMNAHVKGHTP